MRSSTISTSSRNRCRPRPFRSHLAVPGVVVYWAQVEPAAWVWMASWVLLAAHLWVVG